MPEDAEALLAIYAPYIRETAITFEYEVPSVEEFQNRIRTISEKYPYIVAEEGGKIIGYSYAAPFHVRRDWVSVFTRSLSLRLQKWESSALKPVLHGPMKDRMTHILQRTVWDSISIWALGRLAISRISVRNLDGGMI